MPFGGTGRLGKLRNEDEKAFDILCRRLQAVSIQHRGRTTEREKERAEENLEEQSERASQRAREGGMTTGEKKRRISKGKRSRLSPTPHLGGDEPRCRLADIGGGGRIKSSAAPLNYSQLQIMAGRKCHNNHVLIGATPVAQRCLFLAGSLSRRAISTGL